MTMKLQILVAVFTFATVTESRWLYNANNFKVRRQQWMQLSKLSSLLSKAFIVPVSKKDFGENNELTPRADTDRKNENIGKTKYVVSKRFMIDIAQLPPSLMTYGYGRQKTEDRKMLY